MPMFFHPGPFTLAIIAIIAAVVYLSSKNQRPVSMFTQPPITGTGSPNQMAYYESVKKQPVVTYLLWLFLGTFGAHRLYLEKTSSGLLMLAINVISWMLTIILIGFVGLWFIGVWWFVDLFLISGWLTRYNMSIYSQVFGNTSVPPTPPPPVNTFRPVSSGL